MKLSRLLLSVGLGAALVGAAVVGQPAETAAGRMAEAADRFLATLSAEQKAKAAFAFDNKERLNWAFTPQQDAQKNYTRKGLPLAEMSDTQRKAALELLAAGTSASGKDKATTIMSLEAILRDLEKSGAMVRNPDWYFVSVYGTPARSGKWGWRFEGHHLSLNFTLDRGKVVSATPSLFGANPATVLAGARQGLRALPEAEELAKELFKSLDQGQQQVARQAKPFAEIAEKTPGPKVGEPVGLTAEKMTEAQRKTLRRLLKAYADRLPAEVAENELGKVEKAGFDKVHFGFHGGLEPREGYTYRVQGPTFVVEFLNVQNDSAGNKANHIHSAWRTIGGDFGL